MKASLSYTKTQSQKENKKHPSGISKAAAVLTKKNEVEAQSPALNSLQRLQAIPG